MSVNFNAFWDQETMRSLISNKVYCLHLSYIRKITCKIIYLTENVQHYFNLCWTPLPSPPYLTLSQYFLESNFIGAPIYSGQIVQAQLLINGLKGPAMPLSIQKPTRARFLTHSNFLVLPFSPFLRSPPLSLFKRGSGVQAPENF